MVQVSGCHLITGLLITAGWDCEWDSMGLDGTGILKFVLLLRGILKICFLLNLKVITSGYD